VVDAVEGVAAAEAIRHRRRWWSGSRRHLLRLLEAGELVVAKLVELHEAAEVVVEAAAFVYPIMINFSKLSFKIYSGQSLLFQRRR
jgi:hypothetical protein